MTENKRRFGKQYAFVLILFLSICLMAQGASDPLPGSSSAPVGEEQWTSFRSDLEAVLGKIGPDLKSLHFNVEVTAGTTFLGSGSVRFERDSFWYLELFSRQTACKFFHQNGTGTCYLANASQSIMFRGSGDTQVPAPMIHIDKDGDQGYRLDLQMLLKKNNASQPMDLWVHPGTAGYLAGKIKAKFPLVATGPDRVSFFAESRQTPNVVWTYKDKTIVGFKAWFDRQGGAPICLSSDRFVVNQGTVAPDLAFLAASAHFPTGDVERVTNFVSWFYSFLGEFMPREGE